ncbi:archease [candidate division KSB1 bacterium]|nr:archease [candidate division KSB1 bacterium]
MIDKRFRAVDHSGDLAVEAWGADELEALANASLGLVAQLVPLDTIEEREQFPLWIADEDVDRRMIAYLNEIIYLISARRWLPCSVKYMTNCNSKDCNELQVVLGGEPLDPTRHELKYDVKAVTYHGFRVTKETGMVKIYFVCDL